MTWRVEWTARSVTEARRLDREVRERIIEAIERLAETGQGEVVSLKKPLSGYRLRIGDWRVSFDRDTSTNTIIIKHVRHRSQAYR